MTQQKKEKKKKGKSGAKIDLSAPAAEIQITIGKKQQHLPCKLLRVWSLYLQVALPRNIYHCNLLHYT